ncbi:MAG TPA: DUF362 domain-containing protein [Longilinea sp.]|nr:DUF362 domain-containing protein [Longilinea sp.]
MPSPSFVVVTHAPAMNYRRDYVSLPRDFGTPAYEGRADIQAIRAAVKQNLDLLEEKTHFLEKVRGKKVVIKPNLVSVWHEAGLKDDNYPESTDPRVMEAVVIYMKQYTDRIVIVESAGRGYPTTGAFKVAGLDRLARRYGVELIALEEQATDRYILPKAKVMKEIVVPRIFSEVARHEAFYISLPKMKTNLYTGVTLGFKNAMGTITYNLRQRNHTYAIDQKLVDMLYLFRPDLVVIDGIVGGEGNCPAPVEPVDSRVIISGNQAVETDRVATRMMGFDPNCITLMKIADEMGFNDPKVTVLGDTTPTKFRPADPSLQGDWMAKNFPNVHVYEGHSLKHTPKVDPTCPICPTDTQAMENTCRGGCLATTRFAFDMLYYEGHGRDFEMNLIIGEGVKKGNTHIYYDAQGKPVDVEDILAQNKKTLAVGTCAGYLRGRVSHFANGCMPYPNTPHMLVHQISGSMCRVMSPGNKFLLPLLVATLRMCERRKAWYRKGVRLDVPIRLVDGIVEPPMEGVDTTQDYVAFPMPPLTPDEIRTLVKAENRAVLATFLPE